MEKKKQIKTTKVTLTKLLWDGRANLCFNLSFILLALSKFNSNSNWFYTIFSIVFGIIGLILLFYVEDKT